MSDKTETNPQRKVAIAVAVYLLFTFAADILIIGHAGEIDSLITWDSPWWMREVFIPWIGGLNIGFLVAQLLIAVLYAAWVDGSTPRRLLYTTFVLAAFVQLLMVFAARMFEFDWNILVGCFLFLLLGFFVFQIPLWSMRVLFGWTIISPWSSRMNQHRMRFTMAHMLGWSVFLAVPLTIAPVLFPHQNAAAILLTFGAFLLIGTAQVATYTCLVLGTWYPSIVRRGLIVAVMLAGFGLQLLTWYLPMGNWRVGAILCFAAINISGTVLVLLCLLAARALGYRLVRPAWSRAPSR